MKKILFFLTSAIAFLFGSPALLEDTDEIVEIHESHQPINADTAEKPLHEE